MVWVAMLVFVLALGVAFAVGLHSARRDRRDGYGPGRRLRSDSGDDRSSG